MKLRRLIAILLMTLANIFILAHAVTPHYHHDGIVCFSAEMSQCEGNPSSQTDNCCASQEQHHSHLDYCDLLQKVERYGDPIDEIKLFSADVHLFALDCFLLFGYYDFAPIHLVINEYEHRVTITNTYNSPYLGSIFGLRAPPTSIIS